VVIGERCMIFNQVIIYEGVDIAPDCVVEDRVRIGFEIQRWQGHDDAWRMVIPIRGGVPGPQRPTQAGHGKPLTPRPRRSRPYSCHVSYITSSSAPCQQTTASAQLYQAVRDHCLVHGRSWPVMAAGIHALPGCPRLFG
jgi:hypothetical protein